MPWAKKTKRRTEECCDQFNKNRKERSPEVTACLNGSKQCPQAAQGCFPALKGWSPGVSLPDSAVPRAPPLPLPLFSAVQIPYPLDFFNAIVEGLNQRKTREPPRKCRKCAFSWSCPWYRPECFRESFPLWNGGRPLVFVAAEDSWAPVTVPRKPEQQGHTLCLSPEGRAGRAVSVQTLPCLPAAWLLSSDVAARQEREEVGGEPTLSLRDLQAHPALSEATPGEAAEPGSQLAEPLGTFSLWDAGGGAGAMWTPGRPSWGCCPHGVTRGRTSRLCLQSCASVRFMEFIRSAQFCGAAPHVRDREPCAAHRINRKIRPCGADFLTRGDRQ